MEERWRCGGAEVDLEILRIQIFRVTTNPGLVGPFTTLWVRVMVA